MTGFPVPADSFVTVPVLKSLCHAISKCSVTIMHCNKNALYTDSHRAARE